MIRVDGHGGIGAEDLETGVELQRVTDRPRERARRKQHRSDDLLAAPREQHRHERTARLDTSSPLRFGVELLLPHLLEDALQQVGPRDGRSDRSGKWLGRGLPAPHERTCIGLNRKK